MKQAMLNGDAETAASYFTFKTWERYYDIFGIIYTISYSVYFIVDQDGIWRILRF
jgi:hypothetical protein